jgi:hypothetical protein
VVGAAVGGAAVVAREPVELPPELELLGEPLDEQPATLRESAAQPMRAKAPLPDMEKLIRLVSLSVASVVRCLPNARRPPTRAPEA